MVSTLKCSKINPRPLLWLKILSPWRSKIVTKNLEAENKSMKQFSILGQEKYHLSQISALPVFTQLTWKWT